MGGRRVSMPWHYLDLGAKLREGFDSARSDTLTLTGGAVQSWQSVRTPTFIASQAVEAARPLFQSAGFNGQPLVWADGVASELTTVGIGNLQSGTTPGEWWFLIDQAADAANTANRYAAAYGGSAQTNNRVSRRAVAGGVNVLTTNTGNAAAGFISPAAPGDYSGRKLVRHVFGATATHCELNGAASASVTVTPATGTDKLRLFANTAASPASFHHGGLRLALFTDELTPTEIAKLAAYCNARL